MCLRRFVSVLSIHSLTKCMCIFFKSIYSSIYGMRSSLYESSKDDDSCATRRLLTSHTACSPRPLLYAKQRNVVTACLCVRRENNNHNAYAFHVSLEKYEKPLIRNSSRARFSIHVGGWCIHSVYVCNVNAHLCRRCVAILWYVRITHKHAIAFRVAAMLVQESTDNNNNKHHH